jgi:hypothetical protein
MFVNENIAFLEPATGTDTYSGTLAKKSISKGQLIGCLFHLSITEEFYTNCILNEPGLIAILC